ncbi:hypothetical protein P9139_21335 [Curtobacterium flaccumfaciens]|nr:hypothetical protein P9139_21335 [Curtobacterium flaccumfaciens]
MLYCDPDLAEAAPGGGGFCTATHDADSIADEVRRLRAIRT